MRFSLKWILVGVAYVAVAAAAFSQTTWVYADVLWAASLLAMVYALLIAAFARGRRQAAAAGFVIASACFLLCVWLGNGNGVPTTRLLVAAGVGQNGAPTNVYSGVRTTVRTRPVVETRSTASGPQQTVRYIQEVSAAPMVTPSPAGPQTVGQWMAQPRTVAPPSPYVDYSTYIRAGNAVGMMLFGGLGCLLGLVAYKAARREVGEAKSSPRSMTGG